MIRLGIVLFALLLPMTVRAQNLPARYDVTGVAANDVLNIRAESDAGSPIVGALDHDATRVEVIALNEDRTWGMVSTGEGNGWVSMRYLALQSGFDPAAIPRPMTCGGTEPFWTVTLGEYGDLYERLGEPSEPLVPTTEVPAFPGFAIVFTGNNADRRTLAVTRAFCSDGMSDRVYGFSATLLAEFAGNGELLFGCCALE